MGKRLGNFLQSARRHGTWKTCLRYGHSRLNRMIAFDVYLVESTAKDSYEYDLQGYDVRPVNQSQFRDHLCQELKNHHMDWAFERGDLCVAAFFDGEIVAYDFRSKHPVPFENGLVFEFPSQFVVNVLTKTARSHRGRGIARELWKVSYEVRLARAGVPLPSIWTVNIVNLESLAAGRATGRKHVFLGYAGYIRLFGRWFTFASPRCRKLGAGFRAQLG